MSSKAAARIQALRHASWPAGFALVQFPNPPLILALLASAAGRLTTGTGHRSSVAIFHLALAVWAYEEAVHGENWFRRLLGLGFAAYLVVSLTRALRG